MIAESVTARSENPLATSDEDEPSGDGESDAMSIASFNRRLSPYEDSRCVFLFFYYVADSWSSEAASMRDSPRMRRHHSKNPNPQFTVSMVRRRSSRATVWSRRQFVHRSHSRPAAPLPLATSLGCTAPSAAAAPTHRPRRRPPQSTTPTANHHPLALLIRQCLAHMVTK